MKNMINNYFPLEIQGEVQLLVKFLVYIHNDSEIFCIRQHNVDKETFV